MEYALIAICIGLIICPNRYDPAIRFKEAGYNWKRFKEIYGKP
jgi:hypothetical protein